jgi:hypothetical protein
VSDLVKYHNGTMVHEGGGAGVALVTRPEPSLVPPQPPGPPSPPVGSGVKFPGRLAIAVIAAAVVAAVAVGAAAFGGSSGGGDASAGAARGSLAASASASAAASSVAFSVVATETSPSSTSTVLSGQGSADLSKGVGRLTASAPGLSSLIGSGAAGPVDVISDGTNAYVKAPGLSSLTGGRPWVEAPLSGLGSLTGSSAGSLALSTLANPTQALDMLGSLGSPVTTVGPVQLNGEQTTEYQTTLSVAAIVSRLSADSSASSPSSAAAQALKQLGVPEIPVTAWVGRDGLLRQLSVAVDLSHASLGGLLGSLGSDTGTGTGSAAGTKVTLTVGLSHYGEPVAVSVPPASDVTNLGDIASSLKGVISQLGGTLSGLASHV